MARLIAPLLSLGASGTIGKSIVFSTWKGIPYARTRVIPFNPKTDAQKEVRGVFSTLNEMYKRMPAEARLPWQYAVRGEALTARNRFLQANVKILIDETTLIELLLSVASGQAVPPTNAHTHDDADGKIHLSIDMPTAPVGYTLTMPYAFAVLDGEPGEGIIRKVYSAEISSVGPSVAMAVDDDGVYYGSAVCFYTRDSDSKKFASAPLAFAQTVTGT